MKTKKQLNLYPFYDLEGMARQLEEQARRGWFLRKPGPVFWEYGKGKPKKTVYGLVRIGEAEAYDPEPGKPTFRDHAREQGWELTAQDDRLQIYEAVKENHGPLSVSPYDRILGMEQAAKPSVFFYGTMLVIWAMSLILTIFKLQIMPVDALAGAFSLTVPVIFTMLGIYFLGDLIGYYRWKNRAEIAATKKEYAPVRLPMRKILLDILAVSAVLAALSAVTSGGNSMVRIFLAALVGILGLMMILKAVRRAVVDRSRILTVCADIVLALVLVIGVTVAVGRINEAESGHNEAMPVTAENLQLDVEEKELQAYSKSKASLLLGYTEASQIMQTEDGEYMPVISYEIVDSRIMGVDGLVLEHYLSRMAASARQDEEGNVVSVYYAPAEAGPWQAEQAWQMTDGSLSFNVYLLLYEDRLVELGTIHPLTPEQMTVCGSAFRK